MSGQDRDEIDLDANGREELAAAILDARWPDGGVVDALTTRTSSMVADAVLAAGWVSPAVVAGRDRVLGAVAALAKEARHNYLGEAVVSADDLDAVLASVSGAVEGAGDLDG